MGKIEELESLLIVWEAASQAAKNTGHLKLHKSLEAKIAEAKAALEILSQPSNTQIQSGGLIDHCKRIAKSVKYWPKFKRNCLGKGGHR